MDTSDTYIAMCREAEEIQNGYVFRSGDWFYGPYETCFDKQEADVMQTQWCDDGYYGTIPAGYDSWGDREEDEECPCAWLPIQDQLQEMIEGDWTLERETFRGMVCYRATVYPDVYAEGTTQEQALIQLVMAQKTGKTWDGETQKWVTTKPGEIG